MPEGVFQLIYASRATPGLRHEHLERIGHSAWRHNAEHGITGALLFGSGMFLQLLEGGEDLVQGVFRHRVRAASQHEMITILHEGFASKRTAEQWNMATLDLDELPDAIVSERFASILSTLRDIKAIGDPDFASQLLDVFQLAVLNLGEDAEDEAA